MTILRDITPTKSFRSWRFIDGSRDHRICVQERTAQGLQKNKRFLHRMLYSTLDLRRFRIIYTRSLSDFGFSQSTDEGNVGPSRMVLAVADELSDIMNEWKILVRAGDAALANCNAPPLCASDWVRLCREASLKVYDNGEAVSERQLKAASPIPSEVSSPTEIDKEPSNFFRILDPYDLLLIRIFGLWEWRRPLDTVVYTAVLGLLWWLCCLRLPLFCVLTFTAGLPWRPTIDKLEVAEGTKRLRKLELLVGWRCSRHIISAVLLFVLMDFVASALMPMHWKWTALIEWAGPPLLIASLLHAGLEPLVVRAPRLSGAPSALVVRAVPDGSFAVTREEKSGGVAKCLRASAREESASATTALDPREEAMRARVAPPGPFSAIVWDTVKFADLSTGWEKAKELPDGMTVWEKTSHFSSKKAVQIVVNVPGTNVGSLQHLLLRDYLSEFKNTNHDSVYDRTLISHATVKMLGLHELVMLRRYKSVDWGLAPFEVVSCSSPANLFTPAQQESLGLRSQKDAGSRLAFLQCSGHCPAEDDYIGSSHGYEQGAAYVYAIMGLDEADGSLTLRGCFDVDPCVRSPAASQFVVNQTHIEKIKKIVMLLKQIGRKENICRHYKNHRYFQPLLSLPQPELEMPVQQSDIPQADPPVSPEDLKRSSEGRRLQDLAHPIESPSEASNLAPESKEPTSSLSEEENEKQRILGRFVKELLMRKWDFHSEKHGIALWTTTTPWTDKKAAKTVAFIPDVSLKDVDGVINDMSLGPKCDSTVESVSLLRSLSPGIDLVHTKFRSPMWGVSARDMVTATVRSYYPDAAAREAIGLAGAAGAAGEPEPPGSARGVLIQSSVDAAEAHPRVARYVRGRCFLYGVLAEEGEKKGVRGVWLTQSAAADPGGHLPTALVNFVLLNQIDKTKHIIEYVKNRSGRTDSVSRG